MKAVVIILGLACGGLAFGYYKRHTGATHDAEATLQQHQTLSNQVAELRTKLALEQGTAIQSQSNLNSLLDRRVAQLTATSNRLVQVGLLLTAAQTEKASAQTDLQSKAAQLAVVEAERDELKRQAAVIPALEKEIAMVKQKVTRTTGDLEFLFLENRRLQVEKNDLAGKLADVGFLRVQLARAEENAGLQRRLVKAGENAPVNKKAPLELRPDGTVRAVPPTVAQARP